MTPRAYAAAHRARRVRAELPDAASVTGAIYAAGFNASSRFYAKSGDMLGMAPSAYRKGGEDADIRFAVGQCALGAILVAQSGRGICAISLGDDPDALVRDLQDRFRRARLTGDDPEFAALVAQVVGFVEAPGIGVDLPLDIRGTVFQTRVWEALRAIPAGRTVSYGEIARRIGAPRAIRAVAGACAANPIAVAVPCHRVVRRDGDLSGYRWGIARKRALLERECAAISGAQNRASSRCFGPFTERGVWKSPAHSFGSQPARFPLTSRRVLEASSCDEGMTNRIGFEGSPRARRPSPELPRWRAHGERSSRSSGAGCGGSPRRPRSRPPAPSPGGAATSPSRS